jgi:hypothetical protein
MSLFDRTGMLGPLSDDKTLEEIFDIKNFFNTGYVPNGCYSHSREMAYEPVSEKGIQS